MTSPLREQVERATVYLTPRNKKRLAKLRRGEKTRKLNEALDNAFRQDEKKQAFENLMDSIADIEPVKPKISSSQVLRM